MATNSSIIKYAECSGSESDKSDKKKFSKQAAIKTSFNIIPKNRKQGRPPNPKNPELSPNNNQQDLEPPARKKKQRENV